MTINVALPANGNIFFSNLMSILSTILINTDDFFKEHLKLDETAPFSDNWEFLGYGSLYSIQNFGLPIVAFVAWPLMILLVIFLQKVIKNESMQPKC